MSNAFVDPYLDTATGLLANKVGATTHQALADAEADLTWPRALQLLEHPVAATGDLAEWCAIHRHLFGDLYGWAGQTRTVDMRKNAPGAKPFLSFPVIPGAAAYAAEQLAKDNALVGLGREVFVKRLAYHYDSFNYIHPFREGNGRTQRLFWDGVARRAGWELDWTTILGQVNDEACRKAADHDDFTAMYAMLDQVLRPLPPPMSTHAAAHRESSGQHLAARAERLGFPGPGSPPSPKVSASKSGPGGTPR